MTSHVYIGAGPTGLTAILSLIRQEKIAATREHREPNFENILLVDNRLILDGGDVRFDRARARSNIFRFTTDYTQKLFDLGIAPTDFDKLSHRRNFEDRNFQANDDNVFGRKAYDQIQIRDLQQLLIEAIIRESGGQVKFAKEKIEGKLNEEAEVRQQLAKVIPASYQADDVELHIATGALRDDVESASLLYPSQMDSGTKREPSPDTVGMPVTPEHGTQTFQLPGNFKQNNRLRAELAKSQVSLDDTQWQSALAAQGWNLNRPPRVRIFFANDILYIGTEVPQSFKDLAGQDRKDGGTRYKQAIQDYTKTIASLVFSGLKVNVDGALKSTYGVLSGAELTPVQHAQFNTARGERGVVLQTFANPNVAAEVRGQIRVHHGGDRRYLPHYQTGSGFVTAFVVNLLEEDIYSKSSFEELIAWAKENGHLDKETEIAKIKAQYAKFTGSSNEQVQFLAFRDELFTTVSRDIINENKQKVQKYFLGLQKQSLDLIAKNMVQIHGGSEPMSPIQVIDHLKKCPCQEAIELIRPTINQEMGQLTDEQVLEIRDVFVKNSIRTFTLAFDDAVTEQALDKLINNFDKASDLHVRKNAIGSIGSFFGVKGKYSDDIKKFEKLLKQIKSDLANKTIAVDDAKSQLADAVDEFQEVLIKGNSQRTLDVLNNSLTEINDIGATPAQPSSGSMG